MNNSAYKTEWLWGVTVYFYSKHYQREIGCACVDNRDAIRMCMNRGIEDFRLVHEKQAFV